MNDKRRIVINKPKSKVCDICGNEFSLYSFSGHIKHMHKLTSNEYALKYGEFRQPKREKSIRNIKQLTCQLCNTPTPSVGMFTHLRDSHNMNVDDYTEQFGEYRPSKLRQLEYITRLKTIKEEDRKVCIICNATVASHNLLGYHIKNTHNLKKKDYVFKYIFKEIHPLCECGCQRKVRLLNYHPYKVDYIAGHGSVGEGNAMYGKHHTAETKTKMSLSAIDRINTQTFKKIDTKPELEFKAILDTLQIKYEHPYTVNLGTRYASVDFYLCEYDMLVEVDGEYWHPQELKELNFHLLPNVISDGNRRGLRNLYRIREFDIDKFKNYSMTKELAIEYLKNSVGIFDPELKYKQVIINKEYFKTYLNIKGVEYLRSYNWLLKKFIRTFVPEFPYPDLEENIEDVVTKLSTMDINKIYNKEAKEFSNDISTIGNNYLKHYFKSYWKSKFNGNPSPVEAWLDDKIMQEVIDYRIGCNNRGEIYDFSLHQLVRGLSARRITISFFNPFIAAVIYSTILGDYNKSPVILDPCCGFGGRLLGFKSKYPGGTYIGCEPNIETYNELLQLKENAKWGKVEIYNCKFEDFNNPDNYKFDLIFTSIPHYNVEIYSNNIEYNSFNEWKRTFIAAIEKYKGTNCYIIAPSKLCNRLGWNNVEFYIKSNKSHSNRKISKKMEYIIKL